MANDLKKWLQSKGKIQDYTNKTWPQSKDLKGTNINPFVKTSERYKAVPHRMF